MLRILICALALLASCSTKEKTRASSLEKAKQFLTESKVDDAEIMLKKAIDADPNFGEAHYEMGRLHLKRLELLQAHEAFGRAYNLDPAQLTWKTSYADVSLLLLSRSGSSGERFLQAAQKVSDELLKTDPKSYDGLRLAGYLRSFEKKYPEAADFYRRAREVKPEEPEATLGLARVLDAEGKKDEAAKLVEAFLKAHPKVQPAYDYMYEKYLTAQKFTDAERVAKAREQSLPRSVRISLQVCGHYAAVKDQGKMKSCLEDVGARFKDDKDAALALGKFHAEFISRESSLPYLEAAAKAGGTSQEEAKLLLAQSLSQLGRRDAALEAVRGLLKDNPNNEEAKVLEARILAFSDKASDRDDSLRKLQALAADQKQYLSDVARVRYMRGELQAAASDLLNYLRIYGGDVRARELLASIYEQLKNYPGVLEQARILLEIQPTNATAQLFRVRAYMGQGKIADAQTQVSRQLAANPKAVEPMIQQGFIQLMSGKLDAAEKSLRAVYSPGQKDHRPMMGLVEVNVFRNRIDAGLDILRQDMAKSGNPEEVRVMLAGTALRAGRYDTAIGEYRQALAKKPDSTELLLALGEAQRRKGDLGAAKQTLDQANSKKPKDYMVVYGMGLRELEAGNTREAERLFREAITLNPKDSASRNNLAFLLAGENRALDEAFRLATEATVNAKDDLNNQDTLAYVQLKRKNFDAAIGIWSRLVQAAPRVAEFQIHMAQAYFDKGDATQARILLARAEKLPLRPVDKKQLEALRAQVR